MFDALAESIPDRLLDLGETTVDKQFDSRYEAALVRCRGRIAFPVDSSKQPWIRS